MKIGITVLLLIASSAAHAQLFRCTGLWEEERCFRDNYGRLVCVCVDKRR